MDAFASSTVLSNKTDEIAHIFRILLSMRDYE